MPEAPPEPTLPPDVPTSWRPGMPDRRKKPTPMLSRFLFVGRRRGGRREGETDRIYVDRPGAWVVVAVIAVALLSVADAYFTLHELTRGATEANPVMRAALSLGNGAFIVLKTVVTVTGAAFLGLHKTWPLGRVCLFIAVGAYAVLTVYHLVGIYHVLPPAPA
jgi:hypothetical protein